MKRKSMMKRMAAFLTAAMVLSLTACGGQEAADGAQSAGASEQGSAVSAEETEYQGDQDLEYVELKLYAIADAPNNTDLAAQYWEELNKQLKEDLNCTIDYTYAAGNDYKNNYALAIASGESYDLIQAAPGWLDYQTYAAKNAFLPLDDLLPEYAPYLWETIPEETWKAASVNGNIYAVPNLETGVTATAFV